MTGAQENEAFRLGREHRAGAERDVDREGTDLVTEAVEAVELRDLSLTPRQRAWTKALKEKYGFRYPFAAHIVKDFIEPLVAALEEKDAD